MYIVAKKTNMTKHISLVPSFWQPSDSSLKIGNSNLSHYNYGGHACYTGRILHGYVPVKINLCIPRTIPQTMLEPSCHHIR